MNSVASEIAAEPLLFSWDSPRRRRTMLAAFLVLSLMAHALCFYIFQIVYPTPVALLPPPARVTFIAPDSEEGRTLLRWIDAEDPAVAFTTHPAPGARLGALPKTEHLPSYSRGGTNSQGTSTVEAGSKDSEFPATRCRTVLSPGKRLPPEARPGHTFLFPRNSMHLGLRPCHNPVSRRRTKKHLKHFGFAWQ